MPAIVITAGIFLIFGLFPYYLYRLTKGLMTHHAELKAKYRDQNHDQTTE